jgi:NAD(P)-dependent dehydrogenase (short-subunit alcohol dehydrogenase family)
MTMVSFDFKSRVALVTGATSGIGRATALAFGASGADVVVCGRSASEGRAVCDAVHAAGARAIFVATDVRDEASIACAVAETTRTFGRLDFAVNAAGIGGDMAELAHADQDVFDDVMRVNARGVFVCMRHQIPAMLASGGGAIVNVSSVYGLAGKAAHHAYVASKHAVIGLSRSVALEYATRGVRVNALCPGVTRTPAMAGAEAVVPELVAALVADHPIGRMATEDEIASASLYLCSPAASYVVGATLAVDGGFLAA